MRFGIQSTRFILPLILTYLMAEQAQPAKPLEQGARYEIR